MEIRSADLSRLALATTIRLLAYDTRVLNRMEMCLTESTVQHYLDEELTADALVSMLAHIDECTKCRLAVREATTEQQLMLSALSYEMELPVPTDRLRARINNAIKANALL